MILVTEPVVLFVIPTLLIFAWIGFVRRYYSEPSHLRNGLGLTALLLISATWCVAALLDVSGMWALASHNFTFNRFDGLWWLALWLAKPLALLAAILATALSGRTRLQTALASVLLLVLWPFGVK